jgi:hypothetical protein
VRAALLPDPAREPLAAVLAALAALRPRTAMAAGGGALVFPADLRHYCGYDGGPGGAVARCCFLSGRQCGRCAELTAAAERGQSLEERLAASRASLLRYLPALDPLPLPGSAAAAAAASSLSTSSRNSGGCGPLSGAVPRLSAEQVEELLEGARLYALQRAWWFDPELRRDDGGGGGGDDGDTLGAALPQLRALTAPLRDVEALRQVTEEQGAEAAARPAWAEEDFQQMALDALEDALAPHSGEGGGGTGGPGSSSGRGGAAEGSSGMAVEGVGSADGGSGGGTAAAALPQDYEMEPEALEALAAAAEALLTEQFAAAQGLALGAGRQEVTPADLRAALRAGGLGHLLPPSAVEEARERVLHGLL